MATCILQTPHQENLAVADLDCAKRGGIYAKAKRHSKQTTRLREIDHPHSIPFLATYLHTYLLGPNAA